MKTLSERTKRELLRYDHSEMSEDEQKIFEYELEIKNLNAEIRMLEETKSNFTIATIILVVLLIGAIAI